ncbi:hypothetical protein BDM02DRAFT_3113309 [Thelephora ganbajun]|uniref:Uncharacterized protein n=1 Tax=Thelephora ganbajun TaxID=370292 RepID=A0ACB6ZKZ5_THEGA|nr:hypothetical protein BDM02DRAFT_3113309 [Thelephora ganbajun]
MDIRDSRRLLEEKEHTYFSCFSSDGGLFAGANTGSVLIWKYTSDGYARWREFSTQGPTEDLRFSPTSSSLSSCTDGVLKLWRLDGPLIDARHCRDDEFIIVFHCGGYIVAGHEDDNAVTITNLLSQTPPCVIDTGMAIMKLTLTGNILLVLGDDTIAAWRLTGEGMVDGVLPGGRAGRGNAIWTIPVQSYWPSLFVQDQTVVIEERGKNIHAYHTETGEVLELIQLNPHRQEHRWGGTLSSGVTQSREFGWGTTSGGGGLLSQNTLREGWVKGLGGNRLLWLPVEWRNLEFIASSLYDSTVMWLESYDGLSYRIVVIKF